MAVIVSKQIVVPVRGKRASDYAVGDIVKLKENGTPVEYQVVHQGLPGAMYDASCDGCWVLRKSGKEIRQWNSTDVNDYANSTINAYLNGEWLDQFDEKTKAAIKQVKIPYRPGAGLSQVCNIGEKGLSVKCFLLSAEECSLKDIYMPSGEGYELAYFKGCADVGDDSKRVFTTVGIANSWFLRSPQLGPGGEQHNAKWISMRGSNNALRITTRYSILPCHILRPDTLFDSNDILKG